MGRDYVSATGNACLFPLWLRPFGLSGPAKQPNRYSLHGSSQAEPSGTARPQPTPLVLPEPTTMMRDTTRAPRAKCGRNGNQHKRQPALYIHASRATPPPTDHRGTKSRESRVRHALLLRTHRPPPGHHHRCVEEGGAEEAFTPRHGERQRKDSRRALAA
jgi:hypothetical protein